MKKPRNLLIIALINFVCMFAFVLCLKDETYLAIDFNLKVTGLSSKWDNLIYIVTPLLISLIYFLECLYMTRRERIKGTPFQNRRMVNIVSQGLYFITNILSWTRLAMQKASYENVGEQIEFPVFFVLSFVIGTVLYICGEYLLRAEKGECIGIKIPLLMKDNSIWRRTNVFAGKTMMVGGLLMMVNAVIFRLYIDKTLQLVFFVIIFVLMILIPLCYCLFLNHKVNKIK